MICPADCLLPNFAGAGRRVSAGRRRTQPRERRRDGQHDAGTRDAWPRAAQVVAEARAMVTQWCKSPNKDHLGGPDGKPPARRGLGTAMGGGPVRTFSGDDPRQISQLPKVDCRWIRSDLESDSRDSRVFPGPARHSVSLHAPTERACSSSIWSEATRARCSTSPIGSPFGTIATTRCTATTRPSWTGSSGGTSPPSS
jgi:hypothetical protein